MKTATISIKVDPDTARAYRAATPGERRKMQTWLSYQLKALAAKPRRSLEQIMDDIGTTAQARGMTPKILESILNDE